MSGPNYDPTYFDVGNDMDRAKVVILNSDGKRTPEQRWVDETEYVMKIMADWMPLSGAAVLDWGCGAGRLAKPLIERHGCAVLGIDISQSMRTLAARYVAQPGFIACDPPSLEVLRRFGVQFDCAIAVWALQHVLNPESDVAAIKDALKPGGRLFILSSRTRFVPAELNGVKDWLDDGFDVKALLVREFVPLRVAAIDEEIVPCPPSVWGVFEKATR